MRFLTLVLALLVLAPTVQAAPGEPSFDIAVTVQRSAEPLVESTRYDLPVHVEVACSELSPLLAVGNVHFAHKVTLSSGESEPLEFEYKEKFVAPFAPKWCVDGTKMKYDFDISFRVPYRYPALTPLHFVVEVRVENGTGEATAYWNATVAHNPDVNLDVYQLMTGGVKLTEREGLVGIANHGNGRISGEIRRNATTSDLIDFDTFLIGPISPGHYKIHDIPLRIDAARVAPGDYPVYFDVRLWLTDHPDVVFRSETMKSVWRANDHGSDPDVEVSPSDHGLVSLLSLVLLIGMYRFILQPRPKR